jgi:Domain of unknown function (DUF4402)
MKNLKSIAFAIGLAAFGFSPAFADVSSTTGNADSATTSVGVSMVCPMQVSADRDLSFGRFTVGAAGGTIAVAANNQARTVTGAAVAMGGTVSSGRVVIRAANVNSGTDWSSSVGSITANVNNPSTGITLGSLTQSGGNTNMSGSTTACQNTTRQLGGTLTVANGALATPGAYSWTFILTATYN